MLLDAVVTSITSKPQKWAREEERRLYYPVSKDRAHLHRVQSFNKRDFLHLKVEKDDLVEVVAGACCTDDDRTRIRQALDESNYGHIQIKRRT